MSRAPYLSLDLRALALFRVGLSVVFLLDLLLRARDLQMFYGDHGVLSRQMFLTQSWYFPGYQLFLSTGTTGGLLFLFGLGAASGVCLGLGYRTRLAGLFCWWFTIALQLRNPFVLDGGDELLRLLLFWTPFLPLSARWSYEARLNPEWANLPNAYRSMATLGVTVQYAVLYFFAGLLKSGADWRETGDALYYTLSIDQFTTTLGKYLSQFPDLLRVPTTAALVMEFVLPVLLFFPFRRTIFRSLFLVGALGFHISIAVLLHFGIFMLIALAGLTVFVPTAWLDRVCGAHGGEGSGDGVPGYALTKLETGFATFIVGFILVVNVLSIEHGKRLPGWAHPIATITFEHQHWHLFAPVPFRNDGWFIFEVTDSEGKVWNSLGDGDSPEKPKLVSAQFPNQRWRRWLQNCVRAELDDTQGWRDATLNYLARKWIAEHPGVTPAHYRLLFMEEMTPPPGEPVEARLTVLSQGAASN